LNRGAVSEENKELNNPPSIWSDEWTVVEREKEMIGVEFCSPRSRAQGIDAVELNRTSELIRTVTPDTPNAHYLRVYSENR